MRPPESLPDAELMEYADHYITYEIEMLRWTVAIMGSLGPLREEGQLAWAFNSSLLTSFSMHSRNMIDFLYLRSLGKDRNTDIIVQDYIDQGTLTSCLPLMTPTLDQAKHKADKQAAHLTLDRVNYEKSGKRWEFVEIITDIMKAFRAIAPAFPEVRTSESFRRLVSQPSFLIPEVRTNPAYSERGMPGISFQVALKTIWSRSDSEKH